MVARQVAFQKSYQGLAASSFKPPLVHVGFGGRLGEDRAEALLNKQGRVQTWASRSILQSPHPLAQVSDEEEATAASRVGAAVRLPRWGLPELLVVEHADEGWCLLSAKAPVHTGRMQGGAVLEPL